LKIYFNSDDDPDLTGMPFFEALPVQISHLATPVRLAIRIARA